MNAQTLVRQTALLSLSHLVVRAMGFLLRIVLSRSLGAPVMGIVELAQSAHMLLITPVIAGLPSAVSRLCAAADENRQQHILYRGIRLSLLASLPLMLTAFAFRRLLALWLGDLRVLPSLLFYLPCIPLLGIGCVLNGYCYGSRRPGIPAVSELAEQLIRFSVCLSGAAFFARLSAEQSASLPALASFLGELLSLLLMFILCRRAFVPPAAHSADDPTRALLSLALPLTGMRLVSSLVRTVQTLLIPSRLMLSGLTHEEALAHLGMFQGMLMPLLMLPSFITCSVCMVGAPELTRRQKAHLPMHRLILRMGVGVCACSAACAVVLHLFSGVIASRFYLRPALAPYLRRSAPLVPLLAANQLLCGLMNGLGLQHLSLRVGLVSGFSGIIILYAACARASVGLWGAVWALAASQTLSLCANGLILTRCIRFMRLK